MPLEAVLKALSAYKLFMYSYIVQSKQRGGWADPSTEEEGPGCTDGEEGPAPTKKDVPLATPDAAIAKETPPPEQRSLADDTKEAVFHGVVSVIVVVLASAIVRRAFGQR